MRLPPVLSEPQAGARTTAWPPVRDILTRLSARWAELATRAPSTAEQAAAAETAGLLRNLVLAVDAETDALASARDWHLLRPDVNAALAALTAVLPVAGAADYPTYAG
jgi:hypothetical protein